MSDVTFYFIRHGETKFNKEGIFRGRYDVELNQTGLNQASDLGKALEQIKFNTIYSSPLLRAKQTAEKLLEKNLHSSELIIEEAFNNINLGQWTGKPKDDIMHDYPDKWDLWIKHPEILEIPDGEKFDSIKKRTMKKISEIIEEKKPNVAIVTHRSILKIMLAAILGIEDNYFWKFYLDNASYTVLSYSHERGFILKKLNGNEHLGDMVEEKV